MRQASERQQGNQIGRRFVLSVPVVLAACAGLLVTACTTAPTPGNQTDAPVVFQSGQSPSQSTQTTNQTAQPAAACTGVPTPAQTEGPYYKAGEPARTSLVDANVKGTQLVLTGYVLTQNCQAVANAVVEFWQADDAGQYDNQGYNLRGSQVTDAVGHYTLETIVPGIYPGRTRHIHVKVQAPGQPVFTTQLYFPDEAGNARDGIFRPEAVMNVKKDAKGETATFNFILAMK